jgi:hypothetical protein
MSDDRLIKGLTSCSQLSLRRWIVSLTLGATAAVAIAMLLKAAFLFYDLVQQKLNAYLKV